MPWSHVRTQLRICRRTSAHASELQLPSSLLLVSPPILALSLSLGLLHGRDTHYPDTRYTHQLRLSRFLLLHLAFPVGDSALRAPSSSFCSFVYFELSKFRFCCLRKFKVCYTCQAGLGNAMSPCPNNYKYANIS